ncbi:hybrid sensor histidine kinase/response regulator [Rhodopseudomonas palustris]|uniref:histidine kinase n=1 Tax=Rhodopseudomonas palustris (strain BisB18) TaxID=316056 RepID=Q20ZX0_RHOPB
MSSDTIRALLVDDAEIEYRSLDRMLQKISTRRYRLDWAASFDEGLAAFRRDEHDVFLVDFRLGPESGLDLIRRAREFGVMKPIIMLTAYGDAIIDAAATKIGANDYLVKGEYDAVLLDRAIRYSTRNAQNLVDLNRSLAETGAVIRELKSETERRMVAEAEVSNVLRRTVAEQEAERRRITRELHDNIGQSVTLLLLGLGSLARCTVPGCEAAEKVDGLKDIARRMSMDLHRLAWEIRPAMLDDLGLETAIRQLTVEWSQHCDLSFDLFLSLGDRRLPHNVESALYRVVQEGINNVVRHAHASRVGIILKAWDNVVSCIIEDDGGGIADRPAGPTSDTAFSGLGLIGMRERLALVNGTLDFESSPGKGTTLFARVTL